MDWSDKMNKIQKLFDIMLYVNIKKHFTANDVAQKFGISVRTAHRYLSELDSMGIPLYTELGRNGGYRVLSGHILPPVIFTEDEVLAIFFAFRSLEYYKSLPFEIDISSVSRKILTKLPEDVKVQIEALKSTLIFWHRQKDIGTPLLKDLIQKAIEKKPVKIEYQSPKQISERIVQLIGVYSNEGLWYVPVFDFHKQETRLFRADRIKKIEHCKTEFKAIELTLADFLYSYRIKESVHLFVKLTDRGVLLCRENPYLGSRVQLNSNGIGGYIDTFIDKSDLEFAGRFFISLGNNVQVVEPVEMIDYIVSFVKSIICQYS